MAAASFRASRSFVQIAERESGRFGTSVAGGGASSPTRLSR